MNSVRSLVASSIPGLVHGNHHGVRIGHEMGDTKTGGLLHAEVWRLHAKALRIISAFLPPYGDPSAEAQAEIFIDGTIWDTRQR
jgi:hypothetical protein